MIQRRTIILLFTLFTIGLAGFSAAEIIISHPQTVYNLGDEFNFNINVKPIKDISDFFIFNLVCDEVKKEIYKSPLSLVKDSQKDISVSSTLGKFLTNNEVGTCSVKAEYGEETSSTLKFEVTNKVFVALNINGGTFAPEDMVGVSGEAKKENTDFDGFVEIRLVNTNISFIESLEGEKFDYEFVLPKDISPGVYDLEARAYEKDLNGEVTNEGSSKNILKVKRIIKSIEIAIGSKNIIPESEFKYTINVYDQARGKVDSDVTVTLLKPDGTEFKKEVVKTGKIDSLEIKPNFSPGLWKINARLNDLVTEESFFVEEYKKLTYSLIDKTLSINNIGNVEFSGPLEIGIGEANKILEIRNLKTGGEEKFELKAPDGEYNINVKNGEEQKSIGTAFLSGKVASISEVGKKSVNYLSLLWVLLLVALFVGAFFFRKKIIRLRLPISGPKSYPKIKEKNDILIDAGEKKESIIISLHLKDYEKIKADEKAQEAVDSALWLAMESGAKTFDQGDHKVIIFTSSIKQQTDTALVALSAAQSIQRSLNSYNSRSAERISYGLGLGLGTLLVGEKDGKMNYASYGSVVTGTKRIAGASNKNILISNDLHKRLSGKARMIKTKDNNLWELEKMVDRSIHSDYINKFSLNNKSVFKK